MQKTANFNLNQWEASDPICRADFNSDNAAIDAALVQTNTDLAAVGAANCLVKLGGPVTTTVANGTITFDLSGVDMTQYGQLYLTAWAASRSDSVYLALNSADNKIYFCTNSSSSSACSAWLMPQDSNVVCLSTSIRVEESGNVTERNTCGAIFSQEWSGIQKLILHGTSNAGAKATLYGLKC